jgi:voltage-gated potassium channel
MMKNRPLQTLFLVDVFHDRDSRPVFLYGLSTLLLGTLVYHWLQGCSYLDAFYFCVVSLTTIGYGDLAPTTQAAKAFNIVYVIKRRA